MTSSSTYEQINENLSDDQLEQLLPKNIKVYHTDDTCQTFLVTASSSSDQLCSLQKGDVLGSFFAWTIVEVWKDEGIERTLENHESVLACYNRMGNKNNRIFMFRLNGVMYDMFSQPEAYSLYKTLDVDPKTVTKILQNILNGDIDPLHYSQVAIYDSNKIDPLWEVTILLLSDKKLYLSSSHQNVIKFIRKTKNGRLHNNNKLVKLQDKFQIKFWAYLGDFRIYSVTKKLTGAPSEHCLCLVAASGLKQYIACTTQKSLSYWMCAMRLSKYGKQLRDNYRSFVKKHSDANEYEYNKRPLPNESTRSHVAMDFSGNVGRIVEDPKEALAIAQADTGCVRRSWRSSGRTIPGVQAAVTKLENDIHLFQPWFHKNMSRDQAANVLNGFGNKDGVFLIRESKSNCGSFVLTFKCGGKIIHAPILTQMDPINEQVCFTLDNGVTKFYDLLQLVEFYQLNAVSLPTRLMHYVVLVPVTK